MWKTNALMKPPNRPLHIQGALAGPWTKEEKKSGVMRVAQKKIFKYQVY
jgi:hypothetical protein